ncbi:MAG: hypothetical protein K0S07_1582 [Chlamydiales bacterium]|jgi:hypothetical protein|nr:hypothetical protein [Chlamydiales bacterium]
MKILNRLRQKAEAPKSKDDLASMETASVSDWISFIMDNSRIFLLSLTVLLIVLLLGSKIISWRTTNNKLDYILAANHFEKLQQRLEETPRIDREESLESQKKLLQEISASLLKHPELEERYDGKLAQSYIELHDAKEAAPYAKRALARVQKELAPHYASFAKTSLLIAEGHFEQAFQEAAQLDEQLQTLSVEKDAFLPAFNQLRMASLASELNWQEKSQELWQNLLIKIKSEGESSLLATFLSDQQFSLADYIELKLKPN